MIEIENLSFRYSKKKEIFSDLDLFIASGHVYGLLGKNGAGKTTLLKLLSGLLFPQQGSVKVLGYSPGRRQPSFLSDLFFIPEEIYLPEMAMRTYAGLIKPFYPYFDEVQLYRLMEEFGVSADEKLSSMSYGQKKKAWISLGIACNTRLLVMDEPTNGLDIPAKSCFRRLVASVLTEERCIIISTHQVRDLENLIDALVVLDESQILVNAWVERITERLVFRQVRSGEVPLYAEESLKGKWGVLLNLEQEESRLDMELFFNAVLQEPLRIKEILEK